MDTRVVTRGTVDGTLSTVGVWFYLRNQSVSCVPWPVQLGTYLISIFVRKLLTSPYWPQSPCCLQMKVKHACYKELVTFSCALLSMVFLTGMLGFKGRAAVLGSSVLSFFLHAVSLTLIQAVADLLAYQIVPSLIMHLCDLMGTHVEALDEAKQSLDSVVRKQEGEISEQKSVVRELEGEISGKEDVISKLRGEIRELEGEISEQKDEISEQKDEISDLESKISDLESKISELEGEIREQKDEISDLESKISEPEGDKIQISEQKDEISELEGDKIQISEQKDEISELEGDKIQISEQKDEISELEGDKIRGQKDETSKLEGEISELETTVKSLSECKRGTEPNCCWDVAAGQSCLGAERVEKTVTELPRCQLTLKEGVVV